MHWIDWLIVCVPIAVVFIIGFKAQKYVKGVADFLTAGRVAGRYVIAVSQGEASMGLISLIAMFEAHYRSGFVYGFWGHLAAPIFIILGLTGYCIYRFRETRAMTMGQFLEIRYNRAFRILAASLQSLSGIINYGLFPAVGARFIVYFCDLPIAVSVAGWSCPTFALVMATFLFIAALVACMGGQITIMVTDCVQGLLSYPLYTAIVLYIILRFSWFDDLAPVLFDRPPGKSLLNPFDIAGLRDFNLFYVIVGILGSIINRMSWSGTQGYSTAAKSAHEQKMGAIISGWRQGFSGLMFGLLGVVSLTYLSSPHFTGGPNGSVECRTALAEKAFDDVAAGGEFDVVRADYKHYLATGEINPALQARLDVVEAERAAATAITEAAHGRSDPAGDGADEVADTPVDKEPMLTVGQTALKSVDKKKAQTFATIFGQMRVPMAIKYILPVGLVGAFCALCIFLLISTDTTYLHSWAGILVQDLILPIRGKPFTPKQQLTLLRVFIVSVALFAFFFSYFFGQVDYILMFFAITGAIWLGGAGACIVGGLYWKRGTTAGAFAALITGSSLATAGAIGQQLWVKSIYPLIIDHGWLGNVTRVVEGISAPMEPFIQWRVTPDKFPINSQEVYAITIFTSLFLYIAVSLLTCRQPFNIDRMLHRGKYQREGKVIDHRIKGVRDFLSKMIGINEEYSRGDKILARTAFVYSFVWGFLGCFVTIAVWNIISPWPNEWWSYWFYIHSFIISFSIGVVTTIWFSIGGTWDLYRMFKRLKEKQSDILDDGRVIGHVSADDIALVETVDHIRIEEAHIEEAILAEELREERKGEP